MLGRKHVKQQGLYHARYPALTLVDFMVFVRGGERKVLMGCCKLGGLKCVPFKASVVSSCGLPVKQDRLLSFSGQNPAGNHYCMALSVNE